MAGHGSFRAAILCWLICSVGFPLAARPVPKEKRSEKKVKFGKEVQIAWGRLGADGACISYGVFVSSGAFFEGLERIEQGETFPRFEFRKNGAVVRTFPDEVQLGLDVQVTGCANSPSDTMPPPFGIPPPPSDFWQHPRLDIRWKRSAGLRPAKVLSLEVHQVPWQETRYVWYYLLKLESKDVPLSDQLEVSLLGQDGQRVAVLTGGLADLWLGTLMLPPEQKRPDP